MLVHRRVTPSSKFAGTHLYTWVERGTMRVKCLAQEHNAVPRQGLEPGPPDPESSALTIRPSRLPREWSFTKLRWLTKIRGDLNLMTDKDVCIIYVPQYSGYKPPPHPCLKALPSTWKQKIHPVKAPLC